jgi:hypothetical protein
LLPDHAPDATHEVASVLFQDSVDGLPNVIDDGLMPIETVGGLIASVTVRVTDLVMLPPAPVHASW